MNCNYKIGDIVKVTVSEIKPYAAFLKMPDGQSGMIHISELSDSYIKDIERFVCKGDEIAVKILSIDERDNFIRASFKQVPSEQQFTTHTNSRHALKTDQEDFDSLKRNIPDWIKESLKRHDK